MVKNAGQALHFDLYDMLGHKIYTKNVAAESAVLIDTSQIPSGIYVAAWRAAALKKTYVVRLEISK
jgi:fatty acid-binding protein DegV